MKPVSINNFLDKFPIDVKTQMIPRCGNLVLISQSIGSCSLHHSMRPDQARALAAALVAGAEEMENVVKP